MSTTSKLTSVDHLREKVSLILCEAEKIILGKRTQVQLALCALLADGHLLIEDVPGVGKTTLVKFLVKVMGLQGSRIQFTNDLLPADIIGTSIFDASSSSFRFHKGPLFAEVVIADELNRATPKTQSACLQAMEERSVSVDGMTYQLPKPFFMIATQNPKEQAGTYVLPESQLDRFIMRIEMGYPDRDSERALLTGAGRVSILEELEPILNSQEILMAQTEVTDVFVSEPVLDYIQDILDFSRSHGTKHWGLSPRAGLALIRASQAWAYLEGREMVLPDDVQAVGISVMGHRLNRSDELDSQSGRQSAEEILKSVILD